MSRVRCAECGKVYTYETDDFCPQCGAYNQPKKTSGSTMRVDGVNEDNHAGSFSHSELHREKAVRQVTGLDQGPGQEWLSGMVQKVMGQEKPVVVERKNTKKKQVKMPIIPLVIWIIVLYQLMMLILSLVR